MRRFYGSYVYLSSFCDFVDNQADSKLTQSENRLQQLEKGKSQISMIWGVWGVVGDRRPAPLQNSLQVFRLLLFLIKSIKSMEENIVTHENLAVQYFVELKESRAENKQLRDRMEALEGIFRGKYVKYGVLCCIYVA